MNPQQLEAFYAKLAKQGRAEFTLILKASPDDTLFQENDPVAIVSIIGTDAVTNEVLYTKEVEMSAKVPQKSFTIDLVTVFGVMKRFFRTIRRKEKPRPLKVAVVVEPHDGWKDRYEAQTYTLKVTLGANDPVHVWLRPKPRLLQKKAIGPRETD